MAAKYQEARTFTPDREKLSYNCKLALMEAGLIIKYEDASSGMILAKRDMSALTNGMDVILTYDSTGNVHIKSESSMPLELFDWGRNKRNVHKIFDKLAAKL